jgi:hypothetical protein
MGRFPPRLSETWVRPMNNWINWKMEKLGISLEDVTRKLLDEGIEKFVKPYDKLIETIAEKQANLITA